MSFFNQGVAVEEKVVVQRASRPFLAALLAESSAETKPRRPRHHVRSHGLERPNLIKQKQQDIAARRLAEAAKIATKKNITLEEALQWVDGRRYERKGYSRARTKPLPLGQNQPNREAAPAVLPSSPGPSTL